MAIDVVFPRGNEAALAAMAQHLGFAGICFAYKGITPQIRRKLQLLHRRASFPLFTASLTSRQADLLLNLHANKAGPQLDAVFDVEPLRARDFAKMRNAGLSGELAVQLQRYDVLIGFSIHSLLAAADLPCHLGRVRQNIRLCRREGVGIALASLAREPYRMRSPPDMSSLFISLGMTPGEVKKALAALEQRALANRQQGGRSLQGVEWLS